MQKRFSRTATAARVPERVRPATDTDRRCHRRWQAGCRRPPLPGRLFGEPSVNAVRWDFDQPGRGIGLQRKPGCGHAGCPASSRAMRCEECSLSARADGRLRVSQAASRHAAGRLPATGRLARGRGHGRRHRVGHRCGPRRRCPRHHRVPDPRPAAGDRPRALGGRRPRRRRRSHPGWPAVPGSSSCARTTSAMSCWRDRRSGSPECACSRYRVRRPPSRGRAG